MLIRVFCRIIIFLQKILFFIFIIFCIWLVFFVKGVEVIIIFFFKLGDLVFFEFCFGGYIGSIICFVFYRGVVWERYIIFVYSRDLCLDGALKGGEYSYYKYFRFFFIENYGKFI